MSNACITVDGATLFNGELGQWVSQPPDIIIDMMKPEASPRPYLKAVMVTLVDAITTDHNVSINVHTNGAGWSMTVS